jgi:hypothetical protein
MLHIKARHQDTEQLLEMDEVKEDVQRGDLVVLTL